MLENLVKKKSLKLMISLIFLAPSLAAQYAPGEQVSHAGAEIIFGYDIEHQTAGWTGRANWQLLLGLEESSAVYWGFGLGNSPMIRPVLTTGWPFLRYEEDSPYQDGRVPFLDWPRGQFPDFQGDLLFSVGLIWENLDISLSWGSPFSYQDETLYPLGANEAWAQSSFVLLDLLWETIPGGSLETLFVLPVSYGDQSSPGFSLTYRHPLIQWDEWRVLKAYAGGSIRLPQPDASINFDLGWEGVAGLILEPLNPQELDSLLFDELPIDDGAAVYLHVLSPRDRLYEGALYNLSSSLASHLPIGPGDLTFGVNLSGILSFVDTNGQWSPFIGLKEFAEYKLERFRFGLGSQYQYGESLGAVSGELFLRAGLGIELFPKNEVSLIWKSNNLYPTTGTPAGSLEISFNSQFF
jgi:hypothetical protein